MSYRQSISSNKSNIIIGTITENTLRVRAGNGTLKSGRYIISCIGLIIIKKKLRIPVSSKFIRITES
ncbi:MAG: hypothetical protein RIR51_2183 [Bacteroidota bacterium]